MSLLVEVVEEKCYYKECHVTFWITANHHQDLVRKKTTFFCPNGHSQSYKGQTDAQLLEELRRIKDIEIANLTAEIRSLNRKLKRSRDCPMPFTLYRILTVGILTIALIMALFNVYNAGVERGRETIPAQPLSCPFPLTTKEVQTPKVWRIATSTDQGPKG